MPIYGENSDRKYNPSFYYNCQIEILTQCSIFPKISKVYITNILSYIFEKLKTIIFKCS